MNKLGIRSVVAITTAVLTCVAYGDRGGVLAGQSAGAAHVHGAAAPAPAPTNAPGNARAREALAHPLPIVIDGAREPERIPDRLAYFHLIMAMAQPANPTNLQSGRRNALLNALALSPRDRAALVASLSGVREGLDQVTRERRGLTAKTLVSISAQATASTLKTREETLLVDAHGRLTTGLSPDGAARLESFIQNRVKRRMVVYGDAPQ